MKEIICEEEECDDYINYMKSIKHKIKCGCVHENNKVEDDSDQNEKIMIFLQNYIE